MSRAWGGSSPGRCTVSDSVITVAEAATRLGISPRQVRTRAAAANVGARRNPRMIVFTPAEFEILSKRRPSGWPKGRPRKESTMPTTYCTDSGELRITFHIPAECEGTGSGSDECQGGWYFELSHEDSGVYHYSQSYPTAEAALAAAEEWERMEWEKERPS